MGCDVGWPRGGGMSYVVGVVWFWGIDVAVIVWDGVGWLVR